MISYLTFFVYNIFVVYVSSFFRIRPSIASYSSDALKHKEAPIVDNSVILSDKEVNERKKLENLISLPKEVISSKIK